MYELADALLGRRRLRLVRGEQLGARRRRTAPATTSSYWQGHDWWGVGPGAHSHVGGVRWWNVKHPAAYAERIAAGESPAPAARPSTPRRASRARAAAHAHARRPADRALTPSGRARSPG